LKLPKSRAGYRLRKLLDAGYFDRGYMSNSWEQNPGIFRITQKGMEAIGK